MNSSLQYLWNVFFGPKLYGRFSQPQLYQGNIFESTGDSAISFANGFRHFCSVIAPIIAIEIYRRKLYHPDVLLHFGQMVALYYTASIFMRTLGRLNSKEYKNFATLLTECQMLGAKDQFNLRLLKDYDYQVRYGPIDYKQPIRASNLIVLPPAKDYTKSSNFLLATAQDYLCYFAVHTFGRRMLYPGSVALLKTMVNPALLEGRRKLVRDKRANRAVVQTLDGNLIDTMFVDRRNSTQNGNVLVLVSEGNAGFYEVGCMAAPLASGYSVLGWNHPGFAESTGQPYPDQEMAAADAVMQYALNKLGFQEQDIVFHGWSIGGYPTTFLAMNYKHARAVVVDATFDDLVELAKSKMPLSWGSLVHQAIREDLNLPIVDQLIHYHGPITIIRRTNDEIIVTNESANSDERLRSNLATPLIKKLLTARYPTLVDDRFDETVDKWLYGSKRSRRDIEAGIEDNWCVDILLSAVETQPPPLFPLTDGLTDLTDHQRSMLLTFLLKHLLVDFEATHNTPLSSALFSIPQHPWVTDHL